MKGVKCSLEKYGNDILIIIEIKTAVTDITHPLILFLLPPLVPINEPLLHRCFKLIPFARERLSSSLHVERKSRLRKIDLHGFGVSHGYHHVNRGSPKE